MMKQRFIGKETKLATNNFQISNYKMVKPFIIALLEIKRAAALSVNDLKIMPQSKMEAIVATCEQLIDNFEPDLFPVDVFQTGSGTSTNMNVNEVVAHFAAQKTKQKIHPNDDVNWGQSSNCVIPSAINISNYLLLDQLMIELKSLNIAFNKIIEQHKKTLKCGRTHLQDAVPMTVAQEFSAYVAAIENNISNLNFCQEKLTSLPVGGTAVGTGLTAHRHFQQMVVYELATRLKVPFQKSPNNFHQISLREEQVLLMHTLSGLCSTLIKISNDLRLLASGPQTGLAEITFSKLQAGSSVMPGKVNPVMLEMMLQVCALIIGRAHTVNIANQNGPLQLNIMMPLIAFITNDSLLLLTNAISSFRQQALAKLQVNKANMNAFVNKSAAIITLLKNHPRVGYDRATKLVAKATKTNKPIITILKETKLLTPHELKQLLDFEKMTNSGGKNG